MVVQGPTANLRNLLLHEDRRGLEHFIAKHNRYSTLEAIEIYRHRERWPGTWRFLNDRTARRRYIKYCVAPKLALPWFFRFIYMYFIRGGILDRRAGLNLCLLISTYELFIRAKHDDLVRTGGNEPMGIRGLAIAEGGGIPEEPVIIHAPSTVIASPQPAQAPAAPEPAVQVVAKSASLTHSRRNPEINLWNPMEKLKRALWIIVRTSVFRPSFQNWYGLRRFLLKLFGAKVGRGVRIRSTALIELPWNVELGDDVVIGDHAIVYSIGKITIGRATNISQYSHLCACTHDYTTRRFPVLKPPIVVGEEVWIAADAFIGPGVTVGDRAVVGARATVVKDVPPDQVVASPDATIVKQRILED